MLPDFHFRIFFITHPPRSLHYIHQALRRDVLPFLFVIQPRECVSPSTHTLKLTLKLEIEIAAMQCSEIW